MNHKLNLVKKKYENTAESKPTGPDSFIRTVGVSLLLWHTIQHTNCSKYLLPDRPYGHCCSDIVYWREGGISARCAKYTKPYSILFHKVTVSVYHS